MNIYSDKTWFFKCYSTLVLALTVSFTSVGCQTKREIRIYYTHNGAGFLEPCQCAKGHFGGLARRATIIKEQRNLYPECIILDAGNFLRGELNFPPNAIMLKAMTHFFGYDALNLSEFEFSTNFLVSYPSFFSTNIEPKITSPLQNLPKVKLLHKNGLNILILGITTASTLTLIDSSARSQFSVIQPEHAVRNALEEAKKQGAFDCVILLLHTLDLNLEKKMIESFPEIDAIISTTIASETHEQPQLVENKPVVGMLDGSQGIGELVLSYDFQTKNTSFLSHKVTLLDESIKDDEEMKELILITNQKK